MNIFCKIMAWIVVTAFGAMALLLSVALIAIGGSSMGQAAGLDPAVRPALTEAQTIGSRISAIYYGDPHQYTMDMAHATSQTLTMEEFGGVMRALLLEMDTKEGGRQARMIETYTSGTLGMNTPAKVEVLRRAFEAGANVKLKRVTKARSDELKRARAAERELE